MITMDEIVGLLLSRNFPVNLEELRICKVPRVKLSNDYYLKFSHDIGTGEYEAYITHKSIRQTTWDKLDMRLLTSALDYIENVLHVAPENSIEAVQQVVVEPAQSVVIEPVQQGAVEYVSRDVSTPLVAAAMAIAYATVLTSIGIVGIKFRSCNYIDTQPIHLPFKDR